MRDTATTAVDMHVKVLDERVCERAKRRSIDVLVYAPHFTRWPTIRDRAEHFSDEELVVVPARELFTGDWRTRKHVLALGLTEPIPDFLTLDGAFAELRRQDAVVVVPHPEFATVSLDRQEVIERRDAIDAVETYNAKLFPRHNRRAGAVARESDRPGFGSSYAHARTTIGEAWTRFERPIRDETDLLAAVSDHAPRRVMHRDGVEHRLRGLLEFSHLGYENTWKKVDRLFLSGTEPTHPSHLAYDGRFDDVSVY